MTNYLVTGGAGFIGSALVKTLNKEKNSNVLNIDKLTYAGNPQNLKNIKFKNNYYFKKLDICNQTIMNTLFKVAAGSCWANLTPSGAARTEPTTIKAKACKST